MHSHAKKKKVSIKKTAIASTAIPHTLQNIYTDTKYYNIKWDIMH